MRRYLASLTAGRYALWCYFLWWAVVVVRYVDPDPRIWLTSLGLSAVVGAALTINASGDGRRVERWAAFRFFLIPFCVSSFTALVKGRGFFLIFSPRWGELAAAAAACALLGVLARLARRGTNQSGSFVPPGTKLPD